MAAKALVMKTVIQYRKRLMFHLSQPAEITIIGIVHQSMDVIAYFED